MFNLTYEGEPVKLLGFRSLFGKKQEPVIENQNENLQAVKGLGKTVEASEQEINRKELEETAKRIMEVFNFLEVAIWSTDMHTNKLLFCSKGVESISGYSYHEFEEGIIFWSDLIYQEDIEEYNKRQQMLKIGKVPKVEYRIVHRSGEVKWVQDDIIPTYDENGKLARMEGILTDTTEHKKVKEQLVYLADHDYLTELPNRKKFEDELDVLVQKSALLKTKFAIMHIDMDGFKRINDTLGYLAGNKLLMEISLRLKQYITKHDLVARIGGDEFSVLIRNMIDEEQVIEVAEKMITSLKEPYSIDSYELYCTASIGISIYPTNGEDITTLLKRSEAALYRAEEMGRNNFQLYTSSMDIGAYKLYTLDRDLRKALERNELVLHYQPKVDAKSGIMVGAEALIRWNHSQWKTISPGEFIPLAEENGLIFNISDWTFRTVCEQITKWEEMNIHTVPVSINISPKIFLKDDWAETLIRIVEETKVDPKLLEIEITESILVENKESFLSSINKLKEIGIRIALDDFGTGFSSLLYLKNYKVDTIKIDRDFIHDNLSENDAHITKAIIRLAHDLNINVIAEGVETEEQLTFLRQQECDQIQGFFFSKPIPVEMFEKYLVNPTF